MLTKWIVLSIRVTVLNFATTVSFFRPGLYHRHSVMSRRAGCVSAARRASPLDPDWLPIVFDASLRPHVLAQCGRAHIIFILALGRVVLGHCVSVSTSHVRVSVFYNFKISVWSVVPTVRLLITRVRKLSMSRFSTSITTVIFYHYIGSYLSHHPSLGLVRATCLISIFMFLICNCFINFQFCVSLLRFISTLLTA